MYIFCQNDILPVNSQSMSVVYKWGAYRFITLNTSPIRKPTEEKHDANSKELNPGGLLQHKPSVCHVKHAVCSHFSRHTLFPVCLADAKFSLYSQEGVALCQPSEHKRVASKLVCWVCFSLANKLLWFYFIKAW